MIIIILVIFSLTFTTINCNVPTCVDNPSCKCLFVSENKEYMYCIVNNSTKYTISIVSKDHLQIICEKWNGWDNFNFTSKMSGKIVNSVEFKNCGISNKTSLKDVIERLGIEETETLIFKSFEKLNGTLKRKHLAGFSKVKILNLSDNGLTNLPKDLFLDFPELETIDLSDNNVKLPNEIFDPTPNLTRIELYSNKLKILDSRLINKLDKLVFLDLLENELTEIADATFENLVLLQTLLLDFNNLTKLSPHIFSQLGELDVLDISMNQFSYIPPKLFDKNKKLNQLYLHHNLMDLETLPDYLLSNLTRLEDVFMNNNGFRKLPKNLFWGSINLKSINLNENLLQTLPAMFFKNLKNVNKLELNNNLIETLPDRIFKDMSKLQILELAGNHMVYITNDLFNGLTSLTELNMDRNRIKIIEPMAFSPMESLSIAKLSHNQISSNITDEKWNPFYNNTLLDELYLSNNNINRFIANWPKVEDNLRILDLSHNNITYVMAEEFLLLSNKITINLRNNKIKNIFLRVLQRSWKFYTVERDIVILIDGNPILCDCVLYNLLRWREKKLYNYFYNFFQFSFGESSCVKHDGTLGPKIKQLRTYTYLCSEDDYFGTKGKCQNNCTCSIRPEDMTRIMDCSNKGLSNFLINQSKVIFNDRYPLIVDLTGNFLKEIPSLKLLSKLNITTLLLSNNNISQVTVDRIPKNLQVLHLHNNSISKLNLDVINYLKSKPLEELTIRGNPIICDCAARDFYLFIQSMRFDYRDLGNVTCNNMSTPMFRMSFNDFVCPSETCDCISTFTSMIVTLIVAIVLTIALLLWYFRKDIRARIPNNIAESFFIRYTQLRMNNN